MGFIDKLIGKDKEEVELKPDEKPKRSRRVRGNRDGEVELQDEDEEESSNEENNFLPGMPVGSDSDEEDSDSSRKSRTSSRSKSSRSKSRTKSRSTRSSSKSYGGSSSKDMEDKLDEIAEQNERIIELLRNISNSYS